MRTVASPLPFAATVSPLNVPVTLVTRVVRLSPEFANWEFDNPITRLSPFVPELELSDGLGGWQNPDAVSTVDATTLQGFYPAAIQLGDPWRVLSIPANIDFLGRAFPTPQSGTIEPP